MKQIKHLFKGTVRKKGELYGSLKAKQELNRLIRAHHSKQRKLT